MTKNRNILLKKIKFKYEKEEHIMKIKKVLKMLILTVAVISSMTPSQFGLYNPSCPVKLNLHDIWKKNVH